MSAPSIKDSTAEMRRAYVAEAWKCLHDCEMCGKCRVLRGREAEFLYADYIEITAYNALMRDLSYTEAFIKEFEDRLYFGTDCTSPGMPVPLIDTLKEWKDSGLISAAAYRKITHENAMRLLSL